MKFKDYYKDAVAEAIHITSLEQLNILMDNVDIDWFSGMTKKTIALLFEEHTRDGNDFCCDIRSFEYCYKDWYLGEGYTVSEFDEFEWDGIEEEAGTNITVDVDDFMTGLM